MNNFVYCNPVKIVFGAGSIGQLPELISPDKKTLLVYGGGSIKKNGVYRQVAAAMEGRQMLEFAGIEPNPLYETCLKAVELVRQNSVDFLLAVGGGSVLDATKFIAAAARYQGGDPWQILATRGQVVQSAVPMGAVLTLPATGSEMNCFSVISRRSTQEKCAFTTPLVYPQFSILDPEVTYSLSKKYLRNGLVDAFVHVMEQYATCDSRAPLQDRQAEAVVLTLVEIAQKVISGEKDYDARATFMWCATQALNGLMNCGVVQDWSTHMIGHELTAFFGLDHAESLAVVLPAVWEHQKSNKKRKLAQLAERVWGVADGSEEAKAKEAIARTVEFFHSLGMPTLLGDYGIKAGDIKKVVDRFAEKGTVLGENNDIGAEQVASILNRCL